MIALTLYAFFGYAAAVFLIVKIPWLKKFFPKPANALESKYQPEGAEPKVSLIISMYKETRETVQKKIENTLALNYPADKLEVIFAAAFSPEPEMINELNSFLICEPVETGMAGREEEMLADAFRALHDGNLPEGWDSLKADGMPNPLFAEQLFEYEQKFERFKGITFRMTKDVERKGKIHQVNRTVQQATGDIIVFTDADTKLNSDAIKNLTRHFSDSQVGCVAGEKRIRKSEGSSSGEGEGLYWKYESFLKKLDSELYTTVGAAGELFAVRRELLEQEIPSNAIIEDFVLSLRIAGSGYRVIYEPDAFAEEAPTAGIGAEYKRKRRITAGGFQAIWWLRELLNPFKFRVLSFQFISHRVLRWAVIPFLLPFILAVNIALMDNHFIYQSVLAMQIMFYSFAAVGLLLELNKKKIRLFTLPFFFAMMNFSAYAGLVRLLNGKQSVLWEKAERTAV